jgi:hypothetical protein
VAAETSIGAGETAVAAATIVEEAMADDLLDTSGKRRKGRKKRRSKGIDTAVCCHSFRTTVLIEWGTLSPIMNRGTL